MMKRTIYITDKRKPMLEKTRAIQVRQKIVITVRKNGAKYIYRTIIPIADQPREF